VAFNTRPPDGRKLENTAIKSSARMIEGPPKEIFASGKKKNNDDDDSEEEELDSDKEEVA
jgi:hypothetical protein